jgi:hypothetical protein
LKRSSKIRQEVDLTIVLGDVFNIRPRYCFGARSRWRLYDCPGAKTFIVHVSSTPHQVLQLPCGWCTMFWRTTWLLKENMQLPHVSVLNKDDNSLVGIFDVMSPNTNISCMLRNYWKEVIFFFACVSFLFYFLSFLRG